DGRGRVWLEKGRGVNQAIPAASHSVASNGPDTLRPLYCLELASRSPSWQRSCATASTDRTYDRKRSGRALLNLLQARGPSTYGCPAFAGHDEFWYIGTPAPE